MCVEKDAKRHIGHRKQGLGVRVYLNSKCMQLKRTSV